MEDLKVPTRRISVEVLTTDGSRARGHMFHTDSLYQTGSAEDILADLVDERAFVPFQPEERNGHPLLLNKRHVVWVGVPELSLADLPPREVAEIHLAKRCTLLLSDNSQLTGRPIVETPAHSSRLVDKFNFAQKFVPFLTDDGMIFVQNAFIVRIRRAP